MCTTGNRYISVQIAQEIEHSSKSSKCGSSAYSTAVNFKVFYIHIFNPLCKSRHWNKYTLTYNKLCMHVIPGGTNLVAVLVPGGLIRGVGGSLWESIQVHVRLCECQKADLIIIN